MRAESIGFTMSLVTGRITPRSLMIPRIAERKELKRSKENKKYDDTKNTEKQTFQYELCSNRNRQADKERHDGGPFLIFLAIVH